MAETEQITTTDAPKATRRGKGKATGSRARRPVAHPKYGEMIERAIADLKERRKGSSRQAILKYIMKNFNVGQDERSVNAHLKLALRSALQSGAIKHSKGSGASGRFTMAPKKQLTAEHRPQTIRKPRTMATAAGKRTKAKQSKSMRGEKKIKKPKAAATVPKKVRQPKVGGGKRAKQQKTAANAKNTKPRTKTAKTPTTKTAKMKTAKKSKKETTTDQ